MFILFNIYAFVSISNLIDAVTTENNVNASVEFNLTNATTHEVLNKDYVMPLKMLPIALLEVFISGIIGARLLFYENRK